MITKALNIISAQDLMVTHRNVLETISFKENKKCLHLVVTEAASDSVKNVCSYVFARRMIL